MDLVGTCPKTFWKQWLEEGDCAGETWWGARYLWNTKCILALKIRLGDRFYIVSHGKLRGYAKVFGKRDYSTCADGYAFAIVRGGDAVACTIDEPIKGFQGLRKRWWKREDEQPFPDWRIP